MKRGERVAIIGAGLAGALVAEGLHRFGAQVNVFDKSRGTGGRLAAARLGELSMDLGAPGLNPSQRSALAALLPGASTPPLSHWQPIAVDFNLKPEAAKQLWMAQPRSSGLTRALLNGIELNTRVRIARIGFSDEAGYVLEDDTGTAQGQFDRVVIATPAPQAVSLLECEPALQRAVRTVEMEPCWILLLQLEQRPDRLAQVEWLEGEHSLLQRVWRDGSKPGRSGETWAVEARADWSRRHVGDTPERVQAELLQAFSALCMQPAKPVQNRIHRWLYAHAGQPVLSSFCSDDARVLVCGDWVAGGGIEGAIASARQLLEQIRS
ncbi:FAD-dependent oxidoreductase [Marinobacterium sp. BA1]